MVVLNNLDRFSLASEVIDRVPKLASRAAYAKQAIRDKLLEHKQHIAEYGDDLPEIATWRWDGAASAQSARADTSADNI
jgi:xylulose-5-phosphate/fructose-6-phosphate phosphoketolase